jgi:hypothetical protein
MRLGPEAVSAPAFGQMHSLSRPEAMIKHLLDMTFAVPLTGINYTPSSDTFPAGGPLPKLFCNFLYRGSEKLF